MNARSDCEQDVPPADLHDLTHLSDRYNLVSKIGEGTFSTVYKAEDLQQDLYANDWLTHLGGDPSWKYFVAIKRLYVTASPTRIYNELAILRTVRSSKHILPVITSFRYEDQVFIVLPYYKHADFRVYFRDLTMLDIRFYMRSLMRGLVDLSAHGVVHRDIKPCNFLYDVHRREGQLVDFGLAEYIPEEEGQCPCEEHSAMTEEELRSIDMISPTHAKLSRSYLREDHRPGKRANRAGTRGFRAPEVLLKCDQQNESLDIWSAGVILLTFMSGRFPFFNSADDIDALVELTAIFGKAAMRHIARMHNQTLEINLPTLHERPISWTRLITWCQTGTRGVDTSDKDSDLKEAEDFLTNCLDLNPWHRISASLALEHPFLTHLEEDAEQLEREIAAQKQTDDKAAKVAIDSRTNICTIQQKSEDGSQPLKQLRSPAKLDEWLQGLQQQAPSTDHATLNVEHSTTGQQLAKPIRDLPQARLKYVDTIVSNTQRRIGGFPMENSKEENGRPVLSTLEHAHNHGAADLGKSKHVSNQSPDKTDTHPSKKARRLSNDPFTSKAEVKPFGLFGSFMQDVAERESVKINENVA